MKNTYEPGFRIKLRIDLYLQTLGLVLALVFLMAHMPGTAFCTFYFGLGAYQFITSLLNLFFTKPVEMFKVYYAQLCLFLLAAVLIFVPGNAVVFTAYFFLLFSPISAMYYYLFTLMAYEQLNKQQTNLNHSNILA